jgi:hypothetical protein
MLGAVVFVPPDFGTNDVPATSAFAVVLAALLVDRLCNPPAQGIGHVVTALVRDDQP